MLLLLQGLLRLLPEEVDDPAGHQLGVAAEEGEDPSELLALAWLILHVTVVPGAPAEYVVDHEWDEEARCVDGVGGCWFFCPKAVDQYCACSFGRVEFVGQSDVAVHVKGGETDVESAE